MPRGYEATKGLVQGDASRLALFLLAFHRLKAQSPFNARPFDMSYTGSSPKTSYYLALDMPLSFPTRPASTSSPGRKKLCKRAHLGISRFAAQETFERPFLLLLWPLRWSTRGPGDVLSSARHENELGNKPRAGRP